jgi:hypothetical protein
MAAMLDFNLPRGKTILAEQMMTARLDDKDDLFGSLRNKSPIMASIYMC